MRGAERLAYEKIPRGLVSGWGLVEIFSYCPLTLTLSPTGVPAVERGRVYADRGF
jgi:hypothetical protein